MDENYLTVITSLCTAVSLIDTEYLIQFLKIQSQSNREGQTENIDWKWAMKGVRLPFSVFRSDEKWSALVCHLKGDSPFKLFQGVTLFLSYIYTRKKSHTHRHKAAEWLLKWRLMTHFDEKWQATLRSHDSLQELDSIGCDRDYLPWHASVNN